MKRFDHIFCASQASTAVCSSGDQISKCTITTAAVNAAGQLGGRSIDRHNPIIKDVRRSFSTPCSSSSLHPVYHQIPKTQKPQGDFGNFREAKKEEKSRKQSEPKRKSCTAASSLLKLISDDASFGRKSFSCIKPVTVNSSRYLLGKPENDEPVFAAGEKHDAESVTASKPDALSLISAEIKPSSDQVVELRVSLHCRGCEGKVRKHLSRMQGVASFNIDFAAKKVIVTGKVTPTEVLASISKVKNAQLWTNPPSPPSTPSLRLKNQGIKK